MSDVINQMQFTHQSQESTKKFHYKSPKEAGGSTKVKAFQFTEKGIKGGKLQSVKKHGK